MILMMFVEGDMWQGFQTLFDFFPERSPSKRNSFFLVFLETLCLK